MEFRFDIRVNRPQVRYAIFSMRFYYFDRHKKGRGTRSESILFLIYFIRYIFQLETEFIILGIKTVTELITMVISM